VLLKTLFVNDVLKYVHIIMLNCRTCCFVQIIHDDHKLDTSKLVLDIFNTACPSIPCKSQFVKILYTVILYVFPEFRADALHSWKSLRFTISKKWNILKMYLYCGSYGVYRYFYVTGYAIRFEKRQGKKWV